MLTQTKYPEYFTKRDVKRENWQVISEKVDAIVKEMTVQEKMDLLYGWDNPKSTGQIANAGYIPGVARFGVPEIRMYDGPAGVTSVKDTTGLPNPILLAATWSDELAYQFGSVAGEENFSISGNYQLGTQLDTIRAPHFARNRDMKGEDFYLSGRMGAEEVKGVQDQGVVAVIKHFAVANMMCGNNLIVDEQTLHEVYLRQFEKAIKSADAASVMCAYNIVNGHNITDSEYLLKYTLRELWNFKGSVISDWGANHNLTVGKGMDIEMPRPAFNDASRILKGIQKGRLSWEDVDNAARHVLTSLGIVGLLSLVELDENGRVKEEYGRTESLKMKWSYEEDVASGMLDRNAEVAYRIAKKGTVLLKNEDKALPIKEDDYKGENSVALIGLGALHSICGQMQERSYGRLSRMTSPYFEIKKIVGDGNVMEEVGIDIIGKPIPAECLYQDIECKNHGIVRTYGIKKEDIIRRVDPMGPGGGGVEFHGISGELDEDGELVENKILSTWGRVETEGSMGNYVTGEVAAIDSVIDFNCGTVNGKPVKNYKNADNGTAFSGEARYTWKGFLKAPESGDYYMKLEAIGGKTSFAICIDGEWKVIGETDLREGAHWPWDSLIPTPEGMGIQTEKMTLEKDKVYPIVLYGVHVGKEKDLQLRAAWITPSQKKEDDGRALEIAEKAKKIVFFMNDHDEEASTFMEMFTPKENLDNRKRQLELLDKLSIIARKNNAKLIVVLQSIYAHTMKEWIDKADALLVTYMPGQEGGRAVAELLLGKANPSGKLAQTFPAKNEDTLITDTSEHYMQREKGIKKEGRDTVVFSEGIYTGYRWYDKFGVEPLFEFGRGLSYTTFEYSNLRVSKESYGFAVEVDVMNCGDVAGDEIVQLYIGKTEVPAHIQMAEKQLAGYARVENLLPGEKRSILIRLTWDSLCYWNPALELQVREDGTKDKWELAEGERNIYIGASSRDIRLEGRICVLK